jgi:hypothetical protein
MSKNMRMQMTSRPIRTTRSIMGAGSNTGQRACGWRPHPEASKLCPPHPIPRTWNEATPSKRWPLVGSRCGFFDDPTTDLTLTLILGSAHVDGARTLKHPSSVRRTPFHELGMKRRPASVGPWWALVAASLTTRPRTCAWLCCDVPCCGAAAAAGVAGRSSIN